ncbi:guanylate cyclase [Variovorax saccharolyticus]|uniref:guanylate cyclase n=1 Tax=Variovorax saccharolyticus TaxID=3053516 RepID=UPI00257712D9|nr:guanylate cyclase [Variovorax sp. J31P216]MDM0025383.1 guanylate cyclase [Variovorax sp. J31P216]
MITARNLESVSDALATGGVLAALAYLNEGVSLRYTAVYRFAGPLLHNVFLHDKQGRKRPDYLMVVPFTQSFCQFVQRGKSFRTTDSAVDQRLDGHPLQGVVISYHSVPVLDPHSGRLWGTLSHFDMQNVPLPDPEFELLQGAARLLPPFMDES